MTRITLSNLENLIKQLNVLTNSPLETCTRQRSGRFKANVGNFHLDSAYGGYKLGRMCNEAGGMQDVLQNGYMSKRELYEKIQIFLRGMEFKENQK